MNSAVIYESGTGNTEKVALAIRDRLGTAKLCNLANGEKAEAGLIFVGFWTDKGTCPEKTAGYLKGLHGKKVALFGTAGFGGSVDYFKGLAARVSQLIPEDNQILGTFFCQGKMPEEVRERYAGILKQNPDDQRAKQGLANFDLALSHPDQADLSHAADFAASVLENLI